MHLIVRNMLTQHLHHPYRRQESMLTCPSSFLPCLQSFIRYGSDVGWVCTTQKRGLTRLEKKGGLSYGGNIIKLREIFLDSALRKSQVGTG